MKAGKYFGDNFFWVLAGIPEPDCTSGFEYDIIPKSDMSKNILEGQRAWLEAFGKRGQKHNDNNVRAVDLPSRKSTSGWGISEYRDRWDLLEPETFSLTSPAPAAFWKALTSKARHSGSAWESRRSSFCYLRRTGG